MPVKPLYEQLKAEQILVRYMNYPGWGDGLRISVGTDEQIDACLAVLKAMMSRIEVWRSQNTVPPRNGHGTHRAASNARRPKPRSSWSSNLDGAGQSHDRHRRRLPRSHARRCWPSTRRST